MVKSQTSQQELVQAVKAHAAGVEEPAWKMVLDVLSDEEIVQIIDNAGSTEVAISRVEKEVRLYTL